MDIFAKRFAQSSFSFGKRLFRVKVSGEWLSTGNGKEYFRLGALRAVDWPSTPQRIWPAKVYLCTISQRQQMEKLIFCKIKDDPKILSGVLGEQNERQGPEILITSLYIDVILQCNDILWERHALHYPRAYLLHLWGFCYLASLQNDLCAGSNRYTSSSNLIKCQRQNGSWECQMSGIQNQADKHIFSSVPKCQASLKYKVVGNFLEIVCDIFAIFLSVCLDILIPYNVWNFMWNRHK